MAHEKQVDVDTIATFSDDDYGWVDAHQRKTIRADVAKRWIDEGKALPVVEEHLAKAATIETPEDRQHHENASLQRKK